MDISIILIIFLILGFEAINILFRMAFGSSKRFYKLRKIPRIHNMYLGIILLVFYNYWYFLEIGIALIIQDLLHHFVILPLWLGVSEFI